LNGSLLAFTSVLLVFSIASSMDEPIFSRFTELFASNPAILGGLIALTSISYLLACEPAGALVDKAGTRHTIALGVSLEAASFIAFWLATNIPLYIFAGIIAGVGSAITWSAARVFVADFSTDHTRGKAFGLYSMSWGIGWAVGPLVGGVVALSDIRLTFLAAGLFMALTVPAFLAVTPKWEDKRSLGSSVTGVGSAFSRGTRFLKGATNRVRWLFFAYISTYFFWSVLWIFAPLLFEEFSSVQVGLLFFANALAYSITALGAGSLADKYDKKTLLTLGFLASAAGMVAFVLNGSFPIAILIGIIIGFTTAFTQPIIDTLMVTHVKKKEWGVATGLSLVVLEIGTISASAVGGIIAAIGGFAAPFWFAAAVCVVGAVGTALVFKK
jgi:DHA1 family tetracycline resistance protein-like MFS transporter